MALPAPNLDDLRFQKDLVALACRLVRSRSSDTAGLASVFSDLSGSVRFVPRILPDNHDVLRLFAGYGRIAEPDLDTDNRRCASGSADKHSDLLRRGMGLAGLSAAEDESEA